MTIDIDLKDSNLDQRVKPNKKKTKKEKKNKEKKFFSKGKEKIENEGEKKVKKTGKKKKRRVILLTLLIIITLGLGFLIYKGYIFSHEFGFRFQPSSLLSRDKKGLKKDSSENFTNILLVGLDTRENGGLLNTDTIMLASYNHKTHAITLISIPRDFHVEVQEDVSWYVRINSIYSTAEQKKKGRGIEELQKTVERVTGTEIQYYATVDFNSFVDIIDTIGGIDIYVENSFTDHRYPLGIGYQTISFKAGPQTMDGETALKYSRSRHSLQNSEGSDFARARRQQNVIVALRDKLLSTESLTNPRKIIGIISSVSGNIRVSEFTTKDIEAALKLSQKYEEEGSQTFSFVLDPSIANYSLVEKKHIESGAYAIGPKLGLGRYDDINEYIDLVLQNPQLYDEDARIMVYDTGAGLQNSREMTSFLREKLPYLDITFRGTLRSDKEDIVIYSNNDDEYSYTISEISKFLKPELNEKPEYITTNLNGEDVTILLGKNLELQED